MRRHRSGEMPVASVTVTRGAFDAGRRVVGALPLHVRRMREHATGVARKALGLREKVVTAVIADFVDKLAMRVAHLADVRRIDDDFAAVGDNRLDLVHSLAGGPHVGIHLGHHRQHLPHRRFQPDDVPLRGERCRLLPCLGCVAEIQPGESRRGDHQCEACRRHPHHRRRAVDDRANRRIAGADDLVVGDERAEPVSEIDDLGAGDAGKEILVAPREADDLVREHGPADHELVIVEYPTIERYRHVLLQPAACQIGDFGGGNRAQSREHRGVVPFVIEDVRTSGLPADDVASDEAGKLRVAHRLMGSQRDQEIARRDPATKLLLEQREELRHRHRPRAIGDDEQHALAGERQRREPVANDGTDLLGGEEPILESGAVHAVHRTRTGALACAMPPLAPRDDGRRAA